jgi:hypothetical protein
MSSFGKGDWGEASDLQKACRGRSKRGRIFHVEKETRDSVTFRGKSLLCRPGGPRCRRMHQRADSVHVTRSARQCRCLVSEESRRGSEAKTNAEAARQNEAVHENVVSTSSTQSLHPQSSCIKTSIVRRT